MFWEMTHPKTGRRLLLNSSVILGIVEDEKGGASAVSIAGHLMALPQPYAVLRESTFGWDEDEGEVIGEDEGADDAD